MNSKPMLTLANSVVAAIHAVRIFCGFRIAPCLLVFVALAFFWRAETAMGQGSDLSPSTPVVSDLEALRSVVKTFFENISDPAAGPQKGLETLLKNSPFDGESKEEMMKALSEKISSINEQFGAYVSFEPIGVKSIGRDLIILRYLYKCQNYPIVWYFIFYRPLSADGESGSKSWFLIHFYYDSQLNVPLWESGF